MLYTEGVAILLCSIALAFVMPICGIKFGIPILEQVNKEYINQTLI
jgi:hypothetical protein